MAMKARPRTTGTSASGGFYFFLHALAAALA